MTLPEFKMSGINRLVTINPLRVTMITPDTDGVTKIRLTDTHIAVEASYQEVKDKVAEWLGQ